MPKKKAEPTDELSVEQVQEAAASLKDNAIPAEEYVADLVEKSTQSEFAVLNSDGAVVRVFSQDIHGDAAGELAKEFAATNGHMVQE